MYHSICNMNRCSLVNGYEAEATHAPSLALRPPTRRCARPKQQRELLSRRPVQIAARTSFKGVEFDPLKLGLYRVSQRPRYSITFVKSSSNSLSHLSAWGF